MRFLHAGNNVPGDYMRAYDVITKLHEFEVMIGHICKYQFHYENETRPDVKNAWKVLLDTATWDFTAQYGKTWHDICAGLTP